MIKLGQILVDKKFISSAQLQDVIELQLLSQKKLGEILVLQGVIKPEELKLALLEQIEQQTQQYQLQIGALTWRIKDDLYQATYGDELGIFIFTIQPQQLELCYPEMNYYVYCEFHLLDEKIMREHCGTATTLQVAQQLAEEKLKDLL
ncbi:MAG: hypothetical protein WBA77_14220 [Microcoleaceae cyanobacterium]